MQLRASKFVSRSAMIMASGVLLVGVAACADDSPKAAGSGSKTSGSATSGSAGSKSAGSKSDSDGASSEQASSGTDFCGSLLALNRIDPPGEGPIPPTPDQLKEWSKTIAGPFAAVSAAAPDAVLDQVASLSSAITKASSGDGTVFDDGSTEEAHEGLEDQARKDCDWQRADVEASDFKFSGVPAKVDAGALSVRLSNTSTAEPHVFLLLRKDSASTQSNEEQVTAMVSSFDSGDPATIKEATKNSVSGGGPGGVPGQSRTHSFDLEAGEYIYFCPIPVMAGGDGQTLHYQAGMIGELTVS